MAHHTIHHSVEVPVDAGSVYEHLTKGELLRRWFPSEAETDPKEGGKYRFVFKTVDGKTDHERTGQFTALEPGKYVEYTWNYGSEDTKVRFDIEKNGSGSRVTLVHSGFGDDPESQKAYEMHDQGWGMFMKNLNSLFSGGKDLRQEMGFA